MGNAVRRDESLSEAQSAVAYGNFRMCKDTKSVGDEAASQLFGDEHVVECAAAEANLVE